MINEPTIGDLVFYIDRDRRIRNTGIVIHIEYNDKLFNCTMFSAWWINKTLSKDARYGINQTCFEFVR